MPLFNPFTGPGGSVNVGFNPWNPYTGSGNFLHPATHIGAENESDTFLNMPYYNMNASQLDYLNLGALPGSQFSQTSSQFGMNDAGGFSGGSGTNYNGPGSNSTDPNGNMVGSQTQSAFSGIDFGSLFGTSSGKNGNGDLFNMLYALGLNRQGGNANDQMNSLFSGIEV